MLSRLSSTRNTTGDNWLVFTGWMLLVHPNNNWTLSIAHLEMFGGVLFGMVIVVKQRDGHHWHARLMTTTMMTMMTNQQHQSTEKNSKLDARKKSINGFTFS